MADGVAVGLRIFVALNVAAGLQTYVIGAVLGEPVHPATETVVDRPGPTDPELTVVPLHEIV